ncbi:MAG: polysaccharide biosynthesis/export family protein [Cyclobacteriaceae bacterium]
MKTSIYFPFPVVLVIWMLSITSCIPNKAIIYLQNEETKFNNDSLIAENYEQYKLQAGDNLKIDVVSSNPDLTKVFSVTGMGNAAMQQGVQGGNDVNYLSGYPIDIYGRIEIPLVGKLVVEGLTLPEAEILITKEIQKYVKDAFITVRLSGVRFTAIGEFNSPGVYSALLSRLTIMQAIAQAGDLTDLANRKELLLIRHEPGGNKTYEIDLTSRSLLQSPHYFIHPGDVLYLKPLPIRQIGGGVGVTGLQTFTSALSIISTTLVLFLTLNNL